MTTIPKQTQVALSYWNATTAVDGCEYVTTFQEPLTLNAGDSINVRNSSLDTSLLSNDTLFFTENQEIWFEYIIYSIVKKSNLDLVQGATNGKIHDGWVYGVNSTAYLNNISAVNGDVMVYPLGEATGLFFPNPVYQYVNASMGADFYNGGNAQLEANRFWKSNFDKQQTNPSYDVLYDNGFLSVGGSNSSNNNATIPNATGANEPVWLCDMVNKVPTRRRVKITINKGAYTKAQLATVITDKLVQIQNQGVSKNTYPNANATIHPTGNMLNGLSGYDGRGGNALVFPNTTNDVRYTYATFPQNAVNPFQAEIILGGINFGFNSYNNTGAIPPAQNPPPIHSSLLTNFVFTNYSEIPAPYPSVIPPEPTTASPPLITVPPVKNILYTEGLCGLINNYNYMDEQRTNTACCFRPALSTFRIMGGNASVYPNQTDTFFNQVKTGTSFWAGGGGYFQNVFDTENTVDWSEAGTDKAQGDPKNNAYRTGVNSTPQEPNPYYNNYFLPFTYSMDAYWGFTGGLHGTNSLSLNYDPDTDRFSLQGLHNPIKCSSDATGSDATESVVKSRTFPTLPYGAGQVPTNNINEGINPQPYLVGTDGARVDVNDRQSGICFTGLKAYVNGDTTKPSNFWEILGFDVNAICIPPNYIPESQFKSVDDLTYDEFSKYSTNTLYSIDQNINQANTQTLRNNEQLVVPDTFTMFPNPYMFIENITTASANVRVPFFTDPTSKIGGFNVDTVYASANQQTKLFAPNASTSVLGNLGGNILIEIVGYGTGSELQDKDAFAIKSIVSLYYLTGNTFLSTTGDGYTYYHLSTIPQTISSLKVRFLNPITKQKLTNLLGNNNCVYLSIQQNKTINTEGIPPSTPQAKVPDRPEHR
jgi:hypothetical protein